MLTHHFISKIRGPNSKTRGYRVNEYWMSWWRKVCGAEWAKWNHYNFVGLVLFVRRWSYVSYEWIKTHFPRVGASIRQSESCRSKINLRDYCCCAVLPLSQFRWTFFVHFSWQTCYWLPQYRCHCPILCSACVGRIWMEPMTTLAATAAAAGAWIVSFDHRHPFYHSNSTGIDSDWLWCIGVPCM